MKLMATLPLSLIVVVMYLCVQARTTNPLLAESFPDGVNTSFPIHQVGIKDSQTDRSSSRALLEQPQRTDTILQRSGSSPSSSPSPTDVPGLLKSLFSTYFKYIVQAMHGANVHLNTNSGQHYRLLYSEYTGRYVFWQQEQEQQQPESSFWFMKDQNPTIIIDNWKGWIGRSFENNFAVSSLSSSPTSSSNSQQRKDTLIVFTTCNQLKMTMYALEYIKPALAYADLLIVDDYSVDGTVDYLTKKGYAVMTKNKAMGLTDSWNKGFQVSVKMGYKYVTFTNNDVLVTKDGIKQLHDVLRREALVVPMTSTLGAGHNPAQAMVSVYELNPAFEDYVYNHYFFEPLQETLSRLRENPSLFQNRPPFNKNWTSSSIRPSIHRGVLKFNGFCFAVNIAAIEPAAYDYSKGLLFNPNNVMVGQEDSLMAAMRRVGLVPKIAINVYFYHFKSVTVRAATPTNFYKLQNVTNITSARAIPAVTAAASNSSSSAAAAFLHPRGFVQVNVSSGNTMDVREDIRLYHPETVGPFSADSLKILQARKKRRSRSSSSSSRSTNTNTNTNRRTSSNSNSNSNGHNSNDHSKAITTTVPASNRRRKLEGGSTAAALNTALLKERAFTVGAIFDTISTTTSTSSTSSGRSASPRDAISNGHTSQSPSAAAAAHTSEKLTLENILKNKESKAALSVPVQSGDRNKMITFPDLYLLYKDLALVNNGLKVKVYPTLADELRAMNRSNVLRRDRNAANDVKMKIRYANRVIIAIATSDPVTNPGAGDLFTARELGDALENHYSVEVRYLPRPLWYSIDYLYDVDVLVTLLDAFDLPRALSASKNTDFAQADSTSSSTSSSSSSSNNGGRYKVNAIAGYTTTRVKPTLITIAWMRNWFHRWISWPWIGNYDLLLTSSSLSKAFVDRISRGIGFNVQCFEGCPTFNIPELTESATGKTVVLSKKGSPPKKDQLLHKRARVQVEVMRLATSMGGVTVPVQSRRQQQQPPQQTSPPVFTTPAYGTFTLAERNRPAVTSTTTATATATAANIDSAPATTIHYVFTGSYYNSYRSIMAFDPALLLPKWKGLVVGKGWDQKEAAVSRSWKDTCTGLLPYTMMPYIYERVKIVIDDANSVTGPWGSVNSRVFDAIAAGALVISNGAIGIAEIFPPSLMGGQNLTVPTYRTAEELTAHIEYYLSHDEERMRLVRKMQDIVFARYTYVALAKQLTSLLAKKGLSIENFSKYLKPEPSSSSLSKAASSSSISNSGASNTRQLRSSSSSSTNSTTTTTTTSSSSSSSSSSRAATRRLLASGKSPSSSTSSAHKDPAEMLAALRRFNLDSTGTDSAAPGNTDHTTNLRGGKNIGSVPATATSATTVPVLNKRSSICFGVRTIKSQSLWIEQLLKSLLNQVTSSRAYRNRFDFQIFVINTESPSSSSSYDVFLKKAALKLNVEFAKTRVFVLSDTPTGRTSKNPVYGYDSSDVLLAHMLTQYQQSVRNLVFFNESAASYARTPIRETYYGSDRKGDSGEIVAEEDVDVGYQFHHHSSYLDRYKSVAQTLQCEWIIFTNGDNMYNSAWFNIIAPIALNPGKELIGWDFVTHHPRVAEDKTIVYNQPISIDIKRGHVDLASVMIHANAYLRSNLLFLPDTVFTTDLFARDYFAVKQMSSSMKNSSISLVHRVLLMHQ